MNPALLAALLQALATLGPSAIDAIVAIVNAAHGKSLNAAEQQEVGSLVAKAVAMNPPK